MVSESSRRKGGSQRINVEIAPGVRKMLEAYLLRENQSPLRTKVFLTQTEVINQALDDFLSAAETRP